MKKKNIIQLALRNITRRMNKSTHVFFCFLFIAFICATFAIYSIGLSNSIDEITEGRKSENHLFFTLPSSDEREALLGDISMLPHFTGLRVAISEHDEESLARSFTSTYIVVNNTFYQGKSLSEMDLPDTALTQREIMMRFDVEYVSLNFDFVSENEIVEYSRKYNNSTPLLYGRYPIASGEIIASDLILQRYGITDFAKVLNQEISFYSDDNEMIVTGLLCGIMDSRFFDIGSRTLSPQIIISSDNHHYSSKDVFAFLTSLDVAESAQEDVANLTNGSVFYRVTNFVLYKNLQIQMGIRNSVLSLIYAILLITGLIYLVFFISAYVIERKRHFGLLHAIGMTNKHITLLLLFEMLLPAIFSVILAIAFTYGLLSLVGTTLFNTNLFIITAKDLLFVGFITLSVNMLTCFTIAIGSWVWIKKKKINELQ